MTQSTEMALFCTVVASGSLTEAARELELSLSAVSKRLAALETRLGVRLLNRTTRRITLTDEGHAYLKMAQRILGDIATMEETMAAGRSSPKGLLRINATLGFGRMLLAPVISDFARQYPDLRIQLELTDRPMNIVETGYDIGIRVGNLPDAHLVARKIYDNTRIVCASPAYLASHGTPACIDDLRSHDCIVLRENRDDHAIWPFEAGAGAESQSIKVDGHLTVNDAQIAVQWALDGHGIVLRSAYEVAPLIAAGRLVQLLPQHPPGDFDIYAVYAQRRHAPAKIKTFVAFLVQRFARHRRRQ